MIKIKDMGDIMLDDKGMQLFIKSSTGNDVYTAHVEFTREDLNTIRMWAEELMYS